MTGNQRTPAALDAELSHASPRLKPILPLLRALPCQASTAALATLAIADGIGRGRYSRARRWAAGTDRGRVASHVLALRLLATHGRYAGESAGIVERDADAPSRPVTIEGRAYLDRADGGVLLLGFHLGPPRTWLAMRAIGVRVRIGGEFGSIVHEPAWQPLIESGDVIPLPSSDASGRVRALYRMRSLLTRKAILYLTADGPYGGHAFTLDLPGGAVRVRKGWWSLRRQLGVTTLPVLCHDEGRQRVITICEPLPPVRDDEPADAEACRCVLEPLLADYVRRFPSQCPYLAFPPWT